MTLTDHIRFCLRAFLSMLAVVTLAFPVQAQPREDTQALLDALQIRDLMSIMSEEGIAYADTLEDEFFSGRGGPSWTRVVEEIYDQQAMYDEFANGFDAALSLSDAGALTDFFGSERGQRIVRLELDARRAFLDSSIEETAIEAYLVAREEGDETLAPLERFVEANDLVESNVMGALNSNLAFYRGLNEGGAFGRRMSEGEILNDVWSQEDEIRIDSDEWVYSYLMLAYDPLEPGDLEVYTALSESAPGQALNAALFAAFDRVFTQVSEELGMAAAAFIASQEL